MSSETLKKIVVIFAGLLVTVILFFASPSIAEFFNPDVFDSIEGRMMILQSMGITALCMLGGVFFVVKNM